MHINTLKLFSAVCAMFILVSCADSTEVTEVPVQIENGPLVNEFVPRQHQEVDTNTILTLIHYLERDQETSLQNKMEIQKLKDSIHYDAIKHFQKTSTSIGRDGKIATH